MGPHDLGPRLGVRVSRRVPLRQRLAVQTVRVDVLVALGVEVRQGVHREAGVVAGGVQALAADLEGAAEVGLRFGKPAEPGLRLAQLVSISSDLNADCVCNNGRAGLLTRRCC